jgi:sugar phosphate isomerase/epimerase
MTTSAIPADPGSERPAPQAFFSRRAFLAGLAGAGIALDARFAAGIEPIERKRPSHFKLSLAAFSYQQYLKGEQKSMDLFQFVDLAADLAVDGVELTSYYFPADVNDDYLHRLRQHAFLRGLDVSGTAVMNDFCLPSGPEADKDIAHVRKWIDRAAELGAPTVRVLSGNWIQGTSDDDLEARVVERINQLLPQARKRGVTLALENHGGGVTTTPQNLLRIVKAIQGPNFAVNLDTGNFHGPDPYVEIAETAPYAVNVQVKTEIRRQGKSKEPADLAKAIGILRQAKYSGYIVLEYNVSEDPMTAVPRYVKQLRTLIA